MTKDIQNDDESFQKLFFRISGTGEGHWEIERPQSAITQLVRRNVFEGELLDIGCGMGDNAIYIGRE